MLFLQSGTWTVTADLVLASVSATAQASLLSPFDGPILTKLQHEFPRSWCPPQWQMTRRDAPCSEHHQWTTWMTGESETSEYSFRLAQVVSSLLAFRMNQSSWSALTDPGYSSGEEENPGLVSPTEGTFFVVPGKPCFDHMSPCQQRSLNLLRAALFYH